MRSHLNNRKHQMNVNNTFPEDAERKLNVHKTLTSSERLMYVQFTPCVYEVSTWESITAGTSQHGTIIQTGMTCKKIPL